jgi:aryl-alcohol dehydrogenase-like predicted oxidoreductase
MEIMEAHFFAERYKLIGPAAEQPQYNLLERYKMENEYLEIFKNLGMGTTIWSPLASGLLTGKYNNGIPEGSRLSLRGFGWLKDKTVTEQKLNMVYNLQQLANELGVNMANLAIAWCIKNPNVTTAILGATSVTQLQENLKSLEVLALLTNDTMQKIEDTVKTKPVLPEY